MCVVGQSVHSLVAYTSLLLLHNILHIVHLINCSTRQLEWFIGSNIPPYAILSHTWGKDEVSYADMKNDQATARLKDGYAKIEYTCRQALLDGYECAWVDTCCIDKSSSAELSEAINSMFRWYEKAGK